MAVATSVTKEQRAEALMAKGPIQNVRRIMELEDEAKALREALHQAAGHTMDVQSCPTCDRLAASYGQASNRINA